MDHHHHRRGSGGGMATSTAAAAPAAATAAAIEDAMRRILNDLAKHTEKGRNISELFMDLVSKRDYPDYYKIITKPVSINSMLGKVDKGEYKGSFGPFEQDFKQLVTNAMTFNRKGSEVYRDAQTLQSLFNNFLKRESKLLAAAEAAEAAKLATEDSPPTQDELRSIVRKITSYKNEGGYPMFENFFELPDADQYPDYYIKIKKPLALDIVRKRINAKEYKTMQEFESDLRLIAANAREYNIEGSSIYKEAVQLEKFFLAVIGKEAKVDEPPMVEPEPLEFVEVRGEKYKAGDYVYIANPNPELKPTIGQITSTFLDSQKHPSFVANWFLRPEQTVHKASMKFIENEVLKSNRSETYLAEDIVARCWVLFIKDYVRGKPKGADIKHVYACEHRYNDQGKTTSRIKQWNVPAKFKDPELELYEIPLQPVKLASVFAADDPLATNRKRKLSEDDESDGESPGARKSEEAKTQDESAPEAAHVEKRIRLTVKQPKPAESHAAAPSDTKPAEPTATTPALQKAPSTSQLSLARQPRLFDRTADGDLKCLDYLIWRAAKDSETKSTTKQVVRERTAEEALVLETLEGLASAFLAQ